MQELKATVAHLESQLTKDNPRQVATGKRKMSLPDVTKVAQDMGKIDASRNASSVSIPQANLSSQKMSRETTKKHTASNGTEEFACVEVVRNKAARKLLPGHTCLGCQKFYDAIDKSAFTEDQRKELINNCSRHRYKFQPPATPDHYWSLPSLSTPKKPSRR